MGLPLVSLIITTKNEEKTIRRLLESIKQESYKQKEIIIIDNNSKDKTKSIALEYTKEVYSFGPERSAQRNFGEKKSKGQFLLFIDSDMELTEGVIKECVEAMSINTKIAGVVIPEKSIARNFWERVKAFERSFYNEKGDPITDAARFFRKSVFEKMGGYDESITGPEDWDLPERMLKTGYALGRVNSWIRHYERIPSLIKLAQKKYYYALSAHRYLKKHNITQISPKTIYFLRPVFYKNFDEFLKHPILALSMILMLTIELIGGGLGFLVGKIRKN